MKKIILLALCVGALTAALAGCGAAEPETGAPVGPPTADTEQTKPAETGREDDAAGVVYEKPVDAVRVDMTSEDPSNDSVRFVYDKKGRIAQCHYAIDGHEIYLSYTYSGNEIQIYAFSDDILAANETFTVRAYGKDTGFIAYEGYYFKGCEF